MYFKTCPGTSCTMPPASPPTPSPAGQCGTSLTPLASSQCSTAPGAPFNGATPDCASAPCCSYCEADGECNTTDINNCGIYDVFYKHCSSCAGPPSPPSSCGTSVTPIAPSQCATARAAIGPFSGSTPDCEAASCCTYCEGDGECGTGNVNNCGAYDIYFKTCAGHCTTPPTPTSGNAPTAQPTYQCGTLTPLTSASQCSAAATALGAPLNWNTVSCEHAPCCSYCEGDGECGTNQTLNNCIHNTDMYFKMCAGRSCSLAPVAPSPPSRAPTTNCGTLTPINPNQCAQANRSLGGLSAATPNCMNAPCCTYCEGDGECQTSLSLDNCPGSLDVYFKSCAGVCTSVPTPPPATLCGNPSPIARSECPTANATLGGFTVSTVDCESAPCCSYCEGDGECGTSPSLNNCGDYDIYYKNCSSCNTQAPAVARPSSCGSKTGYGSGTTVAAVIIVAVVVGLVWVLYRRRQSQSKRPASVTHSNVAYDGLGNTAEDAVGDEDDEDLLMASIENDDGPYEDVEA